MVKFRVFTLARRKRTKANEGDFIAFTSGGSNWLEGQYLLRESEQRQLTIDQSGRTALSFEHGKFDVD